MLEHKCFLDLMSANIHQYQARDRRALWHPYTAHSAMERTFPVITEGEGIYLLDTEGRRYLDAISSWWACNLGHSHPRLVQAIRHQSARLQHSILGNMSHPAAIELAEKLTSLLGGDGRRVFFAGDGACAVEAALKIAVQYWHNVGHSERKRFVSLQNAYHGDTLGAVSVGLLPDFHEPFRSLLFPVFRAEAPFCAGCPYRLTPETCVCQCLASLEGILEQHAAQVAAVIVEPLCQGAAGMRMYAPACLAKLAELCRQHKVLLIVDEIAVGFGRTGRMFAFEHAGIQPDIVCLGKGLSGGYLPISATVVQESIFESFNDRPADHTFYHGHTFAGNPIAAALALEVLNVYRDEAIVERADRMGLVLRRQMERFADLPGVERIRCLGMIAALDLQDARGFPSPARAGAVRATLLARGILIRPLGNVVYLMPPLIIGEDELIGLAENLYWAINSAGIGE